jgi:hypothetical protein
MPDRAKIESEGKAHKEHIKNVDRFIRDVQELWGTRYCRRSTKEDLKEKGLTETENDGNGLGVLRNGGPGNEGPVMSRRIGLYVVAKGRAMCVLVQKPTSIQD